MRLRLSLRPRSYKGPESGLGFVQFPESDREGDRTNSGFRVEGLALNPKVDPLPSPEA